MNTEKIISIREKINLKEYIEKDIELKKIGNTYFGKCPFCGNEELFSVNNEKKFYHCYDCGENGDVIRYQMKYHSVSLDSALKQLSNETETNEKESSSQSHMHLIKKINKDALNFFKSEFQKSQAKKYLRERKLSEETVESFELGYCGYEGLDVYLKKVGYTNEELLTSGLFYQNEGKSIPKFRNRVIFPIRDTNNDICGFGGRVMGDFKPKYLNSNDSVAFDKGAILFGLNKAKESPRGFVIICEGYMDVIAMHQAGYIEAVASLGTALTEAQVCLIKRYVDNVFICYDMDQAGKDATAKAIKLFDKYGMNMRIVDMSPYKDADEFLANAGKEFFFERLKNAEHPLIFESKYYIDEESMVKLDFPNRAKKWCQKRKSIQKFLNKKGKMVEFNFEVEKEAQIKEVFGLRTKKQLREYLKKI